MLLKSGEKLSVEMKNFLNFDESQNLPVSERFPRLSKKSFRK